MNWEGVAIRGNLRTRSEEGQSRRDWSGYCSLAYSALASFTNREDAALNEFLIPTAVLVEERPQLCRRNLLQLLQRRPALQERTHQLRVQMLKPVQDLREVDLQVARQAIDLGRLLIYQIAPLLHQVLYPAGRFRVWRQTAACRDAAAANPIADLHLEDHPWLPMDTVLRAYWQPSSTALGTGARAHTC